MGCLVLWQGRLFGVAVAFCSGQLAYGFNVQSALVVGLVICLLTISDNPQGASIR